MANSAESFELNFCIDAILSNKQSTNSMLPYHCSRSSSQHFHGHPYFPDYYLQQYLNFNSNQNVTNSQTDYHQQFQQLSMFQQPLHQFSTSTPQPDDSFVGPLDLNTNSSYYQHFSDSSGSQGNCSRNRQSSCDSLTSGEIISSNGPLRRKRRTGTRAVFTAQQRLSLENVFARQKYIDKVDRKRLADYLQLEEPQVKVWFQNRRSKARKETSKINEMNGRLQATPVDPSVNMLNDDNTSNSSSLEIDLSQCGNASSFDLSQCVKELQALATSLQNSPDSGS